jgi:hypothetical protein
MYSSYPYFLSAKMAINNNVILHLDHIYTEHSKTNFIDRNNLGNYNCTDKIKLSQGPMVNTRKRAIADTYRRATKCMESMNVL